MGIDELFTALLKALWSQVDRPEIQEQKFYFYVDRAICSLIVNSPYPTIETRRAFSIEVLERFRENANSAYSQASVPQEMATIQSLYLDIFSSAIFSIKGLLDREENFVDEIFEYLAQFLPRMAEIPNLVKTIGNIILSAPEQSKKYAETITKYLIEAQTSRNFDLITESSMTM